jgi:hypothetical protein
LISISSSFDVHDSGLGSTYAASVSSFVTKAGDADNEFFRVPSTPEEVEDGKAFVCPTCQQTLPAGYIKNRAEWK